MGLIAREPSFLGNGFDDPQSAAIMALSAGLLRRDLSGGLIGANQAFSDAKKNALQQSLVGLQMKNLESEIGARDQTTKTAQQRMEWLRGLVSQLDSSTPAANQAVIAQTGNLAPTRANAALQDAAAAKLSAGNPLAGIPRSAIDWELATGDGKQIGNWIYERTKPNMQMHSGVALDMNRIQPGTSLPQMSPTGQGYQVVSDPSAPGGYRIAEPPGAVDLFTRFKRAEAGVGAENDLVQSTDAGGTSRFVTRAQAIQAAQQPQRSQQPQSADGPTLPNQGGGQLTRDLSEFLLADARRNGQTGTPTVNFTGGGPNATYGLSTPGPSGGPLQAGMSPEQAAAAAAAKVKAEADARAGADRDATRAKQGVNASDTMANIKQARALLAQNPTHSGFGAKVDAAMGIVGASTDAADAAAQLDTLSGWMTSNVPRMEGPQSNLDQQLYRQMAALVGDRTKPLSQRVKALDTLEEIQKRYMHLNQGDGGAKPNSRVVDALPKTAAKGTRARDTTTGAVVVFNGLSWVPEK